MRKFLFLLIPILFFVSCESDEKNNNFNVEIKNMMKDYYLWYSDLNDSDPADFKDSEKFFESMINRQNDHWSFMITEEQFNAIFEEAKFFGHGLALYEFENKRRVAYVFKNTKLYNAGVRRGWIVKSINNTLVESNTNTSILLGENIEGVTNTIVFQKPNGDDVSLTMAKEDVRMNMVMVADTYKLKSSTVGYLVFHGFIGNAKMELDSSFYFFKKAGVNELIVDLRYNTGGEMGIAEQLANFIGGKNANAKIFTTMKYNDKLTRYNESILFKQNDTSLNINRVFFITSGESYSASEAVINGLKPHMTVLSIGDVSGGKPVGMNVFTFKEYGYMIAPLTFKLTNSVGYGDYFSGLPVDKSEIDDIANDWGRNERCCKQALNYIEKGGFIQLKSSEYIQKRIPEYKGAKAITHSLY